MKKVFIADKLISFTRSILDKLGYQYLLVTVPKKEDQWRHFAINIRDETDLVDMLRNAIDATLIMDNKGVELTEEERETKVAHILEILQESMKNNSIIRIRIQNLKGDKKDG